VPGAILVLVCHDEVVVGCDAEQAGAVKTWLEKAMIDGMDEVVNAPYANGPRVPIEVEVESSKTWTR
jgi:DNA polymerase I-like protein with 3'-5' exonuclease and polymerase domains